VQASLTNDVDQSVSAEAAARQQGDAQTLDAARQFTNQKVNAETAARQAADNLLSTGL